jgi:hypothetical protein
MTYYIVRNSDNELEVQSTPLPDYVRRVTGPYPTYAFAQIALYAAELTAPGNKVMRAWEQFRAQRLVKRES